MMHKEYWQAGFKVFPLHGVTKGVCDCGDVECEAFYKHPRVSNWQHTPSWAEEQIDVMEMTGQFATGFGVLCDGYLIIDIDPRNGGDKSYKKLCEDTGLDFIELSGFTVDTGGGGQHIYFKHSGNEKLQSHLKDYPGIDFKSSGFVVGCGSMHQSGNTYEVHDGFPDEVEELPTGLFDLLVKKLSKPSGEFSVGSDEITEKEVLELLSFVPNSDLEYDEWIEIGMIIHESLGASAYNVWLDWSATSSKHDEKMMERKWHSFGKSQVKVTVGTLFQKARDNGYSEPVTFDTELTYDVDLLNTNDINIKQAPGLVGECINYINGCSRYPREYLAVSAALMAISNIAGLRFEDEEFGVTPNIFCFNVAGSSTGKEAIQQSYNDLMIAAGIGKTVYGSIKSEQEIYRNTTRHQIINYSIDEFGIMLNKIENASKSGSASYLGGVIGALMSIYSKAGGKMPLGADFLEVLTRDIANQIAAINKLVDENEAKEWHIAQLESLQTLYSELSQGFINEPYLTLAGYTTPSTFHTLVTYAQATNGFIGRSILFEEKDNNPRAKKRFVKNKLPYELEMKLKQLRTGGEFDVYENSRIEFNGSKTVMPTTPEALELLDTIQDELHDKASHAMETNGLEAIVRRAFELVLKVSMILAIGNGGVRTVDNVRWAYALIKQDLNNKINLTGANMAADEKNLANEVLAKVKHKLDEKHGVSVGTISNKIRSIKKEDIQKALDYLVANGEAKKEESAPKRGAKTLLYFAMR